MEHSDVIGAADEIFAGVDFSFPLAVQRFMAEATAVVRSSWRRKVLPWAGLSPPRVILSAPIGQ